MSNLSPEVTVINAVRVKIAGMEEAPSDADVAGLIGELLFITGKRGRPPGMKLDAYETIAALAIGRASKIRSGKA